MKYAILKVTNSNFAVHAEGSSIDGLKVNYHQLCASLWNDAETKTAKVMIVDEQLNCVDGYAEFIHHEQTSE